MSCAINSIGEDYRSQLNDAPPMGLLSAGLLAIKAGWTTFATVRNMPRETPQTKQLRQVLNHAFTMRYMRHRSKSVGKHIEPKCMHLMVIALGAFTEFDRMTRVERTQMSDCLRFWLIDPARALNVPLETLLRALIGFSTPFTNAKAACSRICDKVEVCRTALVDSDTPLYLNSRANPGRRLRRELQLRLANSENAIARSEKEPPAYNDIDEGPDVHIRIAAFLHTLEEQRPTPFATFWQRHCRSRFLINDALDVMCRLFEVRYTARS